MSLITAGWSDLIFRQTTLAAVGGSPAGVGPQRWRPQAGQVWATDERRQATVGGSEDREEVCLESEGFVG